MCWRTRLLSLPTYTPARTSNNQIAMRPRSRGGAPLHSFRTLLQDLGTVAYNITSTSINPHAKIVMTTRPTPIQAKAFKLLEVNPACSQ